MLQCSAAVGRNAAFIPWCCVPRPSFCDFMSMAFSFFSECVLAFPELETIDHEEVNLQKCRRH